MRHDAAVQQALSAGPLTTPLLLLAPPEPVYAPSPLRTLYAAWWAADRERRWVETLWKVRGWTV